MADDGILGLVQIIKTSNDIKEVQYAYGKIAYTLGLEVLVRFAHLAYGPDPENGSGGGGGGGPSIAEKATLDAAGESGTHPKAAQGRQAPGSGPHPEVIVSTVNNALKL